MNEISKGNGRRRKFYINLLFYIISIIVNVAICPRDNVYEWNELLGRIILVTAGYFVLYMFLYQFRPEILDVTRKTFFIIITIIFFIVFTRVLIIFPDRSIIYLIPFAIISVVIRTFYDARLAIFVLLVTIILSALMVPDPFVFVVMNFIAGMIALFSFSENHRRGKLFFSVFFVILSYSIIYIGLNLFYKGNIDNINWSIFKWFAGNGILVLLCYPLIVIFEKRFLFLSDTTLRELSDTNQPLLRRFAKEAPGSFQHSRQVAILAEEAAREIGANILLIRAGALYHDIGKIVNSQNFIENQSQENSPHTNLDPLKSAKIIINHVNEGVLIARQYKLPVQIIDFIRTHHGTTMTYFFFKKYLDQIGLSEGMEEEFTYPGPKPFSRELAIVMMADAVEASSRTLEQFSAESISELVERILIIQEQDDQFSDAPLTFKDISDIKKVFKKCLSNIYHVRVVYPDRDSI